MSDSAQTAGLDRADRSPGARYDLRIKPVPSARPLFARLVLPLYLPALFTTTGMGMLIPILPLYLRETGLSYTLVTTVIERFSPLALLGAGALLLTGLASSYLYLSSPADLVWTVYGRLLGAKMVGFAIIAGLGHHNWKRIKPRLGEAAAGGDLRRAVAAELAVAMLVLAVTAFLVALPLPSATM